MFIIGTAGRSVVEVAEDLRRRGYVVGPTVSIGTCLELKDDTDDLVSLLTALYGIPGIRYIIPKIAHDFACDVFRRTELRLTQAARDSEGRTHFTFTQRHATYADVEREVTTMLSDGTEIIIEALASFGRYVDVRYTDMTYQFGGQTLFFWYGIDKLPEDSETRVQHLRSIAIKLLTVEVFNLLCYNLGSRSD